MKWSFIYETNRMMLDDATLKADTIVQKNLAYYTQNDKKISCALYKKIN